MIYRCRVALRLPGLQDGATIAGWRDAYPAYGKCIVGPASNAPPGVSDLLTTPGRALRAIFQHDPHLIETITRRIGRGPVFRLTRIQTLFD